MKKSTTKKLTKNQLEYKKQYERISKAIKKKEKEGYEFPKLPLTKNPARVTQKMLDELRQLTPKKLVARHGGYRGKEGEFIPGLKPQPKKPAKGTSGKAYINRVRFIIFTEIPAIRIVRGAGVVQTGVLYREPLIRILDDNFSEAELNKSITNYEKYLKENENEIVKYCHIIAYASSVEDMQSAFTECAYLLNQKFLSVEQAEEFDELYNETMWGEL